MLDREHLAPLVPAHVAANEERTEQGFGRVCLAVFFRV